MTLRIIATSAYKKDYKKALKANRKMDLLDSVVWQLSEGKKLSESFRDHSLTGNWSGYRECHIKPDWLLIYRVIENKLVLVLVFRSLNSLIIKTAKKASRYCHREAFSLCLLESALNVLQPPSPAVDNGVGVYFVEPAINVLDQRFLR